MNNKQTPQQEVQEPSNNCAKADSTLVEVVEYFLESQAALDNREGMGINAEPYEVFMRRRNAAWDALEAALSRTRHNTPEGGKATEAQSAREQGGQQAMNTQPTALAQLRHLYQNLLNGGVRDSEDAKRIAKGLLGPAIEALERGTPATGGEPVWIVNDLGELGVQVNGRFFFLYKGDNIEYGKEDGGAALHDDGSPMRYRIVGKREFGEVCYPAAWQAAGRSQMRYNDELTYTPGLSFGSPEDGAWRDLPPARTTSPQPVREPLTDEKAKALLQNSDLLDMFLRIGWYSAPRKNFDANALTLIRAIEAAHGITGGQHGTE